MIVGALGAAALLAACGNPQIGPSPSPVAPTQPASMPMPGMPSDMPGMSGSSSTAIPADAQRVEIVGTEFTFAPEQVRVQSARAVAITFENDGTTAHDWTVHAADGSELAHAHAEPGEPAIIVMSFGKGAYEVWCSVAGHKQAGMVGTLVVT